MHQSRHGAGRKLPLEADHYVDENQQERDYQRKTALLREFLANLRAHILNASQIHSAAIVGNGCTQCFAQFVRRLPFLRRQSHQNVVLRTEKLHLCIIEASGGETPAHGLDVGCLLVTDLEKDTTREVDTELQPARCERGERDDDDNR